MVTEQDILNISSIKTFGSYKVRKEGVGIYSIIGYYFGKAEIKFTGFAEEVARELNMYLR